MLHSPSVLGFIFGRGKLQTFPPKGTRPAKGKTKGTPATWAKVPIAAYKSRSKHAPSDRPLRPITPECCNFRLADKLYQGLSTADRAIWKAAIKTRGMSAYDLWMSETLWLLNRGENPPAAPSSSGGFRPDKATPTGLYFSNPCRSSNIFLRFQVTVHYVWPPPVPYIIYRVVPSYQIPPGTPPEHTPFVLFSFGFQPSIQKWNLYDENWVIDLAARQITRPKTDLPYFRSFCSPLGPGHPELTFLARSSLEMTWTSLIPDLRPWDNATDAAPQG